MYTSESRVRTANGERKFAAFRDEVAGSFVHGSLSTTDVGGFGGGHARSVTLGGVQVSDVLAKSDVLMRRTPTHCSRDGEDFLKVNVQLRGQCTFTQDGRQTRLEPGDYVVYDTTRPSEVASSGAFQMYGVILPRGLLGIAPDRLSDLTARRFSARDGLGTVVSPFLTHIGRRVSAGQHADNVHLGDAVVDMLTASFIDSLWGDGSVTPKMGKIGLLLRIRSYIDQRLTDPRLDVTTIASVHHISVRYLQRLFEEDGTTVTGWIRDRRIEHCRRDLSNASLADMSVASIGERWGFIDAAHFSRVFKCAHGLAPRDYRQLKTLGAGAGTE